MNRLPRPHQPGRPHWRCTTCGAGWPCSVARLRLLWEYRDARVAMAVYLATLMYEALADAYRLGLRPDTVALHERFLGWGARNPNAAQHPNVTQPPP